MEATMPERGNDAKEPVSALLAGPYGHPFHPILVTVPIGAWVSSLVFDVASHVVDDPGTLATGAEWLIAIGVLGALAAATVGFLDLFTIPTGTPAHRTAIAHMALNLAITVGFALDYLWRIGAGQRATALGPLVLSLVCLAGLAVSGALGGKLAYHFGVRVASETVQAAGFQTPAGARRRQASSTPSTSSKGD
jgi:uncharacterized membrane protein